MLKTLYCGHEGCEAVPCLHYFNHTPFDGAIVPTHLLRCASHAFEASKWEVETVDEFYARVLEKQIQLSAFDGLDAVQGKNLRKERFLLSHELGVLYCGHCPGQLMFWVEEGVSHE